MERILSFRKCVFSERLQIIGMMAETPISVAFSANHSKRFVFLINEIAMFISGFGNSENSFRIVFTFVLFLSGKTISAIIVCPLPLVTLISSPSFILKTCETCFDVSSLKIKSLERGKFSSKKKGEAIDTLLYQLRKT